jgi:DNA-binding IclR family transcriptional regulator
MPGVGGMAFAVIRNGEPVAAIAVSGPADRWSIKAMNSALPVIRELCATLRGWSTTINGP